MAKTIKVTVPHDGDLILYKNREQILDITTHGSIYVRSSANRRFLASFGEVNNFVLYYKFDKDRSRWVKQYGRLC